MLITDKEAAALMGWSQQKLKRLRLTGKLPYYAGRPPKIESDDLEKLKIRGSPYTEGNTPAASFVLKKRPAETPAPPPPPATQQEIFAKAEESARKAWLKHRLKSVRRS